MGRNKIIGWTSILLVMIGIFLVGTSVYYSIQPRSTLRFTPTFEPIIPTRAVARALGTPSPTLASFANPTITRMPTDTAQHSSLYQDHPRWGIAGGGNSLARYNSADLKLGWYLDWQTEIAPVRLDHIEYAQMVRLANNALVPGATRITQIARANPGSLWLVRNEPDVKWQDNTDPKNYARLYAQAYQAIKTGDPSAQVAIGGVSEPTPLRLQYIETILAEYRQQFQTDLPIDVWNIHNFILREERGSWGVDIPPGMPQDRGMLFEVDDSGNLAVFQKQIVDFRKWMAEHGYRNYPLIVSEFGIPMPEDYGFPPERVSAFLIDTFDFLNSARDASLGDPADENRLVQRWCWYSLDDSYYATGRLFDSTSGKMTIIGKTWQDYVRH